MAHSNDLTQAGWDQGDRARALTKGDRLKTQVVALDLGPPDQESLVSLGQKTSANSIPVCLPSDQSLSLGAGSSTLGATKDAGPSWTTVKGISGVPFTSADQHSVAASVTDAPTSGQKLVITDIFLSVDTAMGVTFKCETTGAVVTGPYYLPANGTLQLTPRGKGWKLATADKKLQVLTSVAGNVMIDASYFSEA